MKIILVCWSLIVITLQPPKVEVKVAGAMRNIMQDGNLSAHISLDTLVKTPHLYALGPAEGIKGELMIMDSKPYWCYIKDDKPVLQQSSHVKAAMLVYAQVKEWKTIQVKETVHNYADLEKLVAQYAINCNIPEDEAFPFIVHAKVNKAAYHIIEWKDGQEHTFGNHKQFAKSGNLENREVEMLGFYSNHHQGIFTHHTTNMHVHILDNLKTMVGHLEDISIGNTTLTLKFPVN